MNLALGAQWRDLLCLVLGHGMRLVALGIVLGLGGTLALSRVVEAQLYRTSAQDPATFAVVAALLALAAALACWLPARRAARIDPMEALRTE